MLQYIKTELILYRLIYLRFVLCNAFEYAQDLHLIVLSD